MAFSWRHVVPWTNRSEFVQTYLDLYSKNAERQMTAVETISLWKCRASNKLSVAIESSAALTEVYLQHQAAVEAGDLRQNDHSLRTAMTMALIRFVNHVSEKGQNKPFAQPVHKIAQECGIPEWIVQLRHDGTHRSLPCLDVLSRGVQWALTYLQDVFWSQQVKEADECLDPSKRKRKRPSRSLYNTNEMHELLRNYQKASLNSQEDGPESEAAREERRALRRLEHILNGQQRNSLLQCLVDPGHLLPLEQQLQSWHVNLEETLRAEPPKLPEMVIKGWKGLLQLLQEKQLTSLQLQHMVKMMVGEGDPASLTSLTLAAWIRLILLYETSNYSKLEEERASQPELFSGAVDFSKDLLLSTCVQTPNIWTCSLLPLVGDADSISVDTYGKLDELEKVYKGSGGPTTDKDHSDAQKEAKKEDLSTNDGKNKLASAPSHEEETCWNLCTDPVDWDRLQIGLLPSQTNLAGSESNFEHRVHSSNSSSEDDGRSSEDEPDNATHDPPDTTERSPETAVKDDIIDDALVH